MSASPSNSPKARDDAMTERFYAELREIAHRVFASERSQHTLQPTAVVNEACMRLMSSPQGGLPDLPRADRLAMAGRVLKQVLIDHARGRDAQKRGGPEAASLRLELDGDIIADHPTQVDFERVHAALDKLRALNARQAEVVTLRIFAGMTMDHVATVLGVSKRSAEGDWTVARAWLRRELADDSPEAAS